MRIITVDEVRTVRMTKKYASIFMPRFMDEKPIDRKQHGVLVRQMEKQYKREAPCSPVMAIEYCGVPLRLCDVMSEASFSIAMFPQTAQATFIKRLEVLSESAAKERGTPLPNVSCGSLEELVVTLHNKDRVESEALFFLFLQISGMLEFSIGAKTIAHVLSLCHVPPLEDRQGA